MLFDACCVLLCSHYEPVPLECVWYISDQSGTRKHPSLLGDHDHRLATVVTVVVIVTVMVVLPSVVVASETERLSSFSPHPCKDVETKDPTKMATWHAACASLSLETAVNTAIMTLCLEMLGKSHAYLTTLESGQLTLSPRFQLRWRRNLSKTQ